MYQVTRTMDFTDVIKLLEELTAINYHTEALGVLCQCWGRLADRAEVNGLQEEQMERGYMTDEMLQRRRAVRNRVMKDAERLGNLAPCQLSQIRSVC